MKVTVAELSNPDLFTKIENVPVFTPENVWKTVRDANNELKWVQLQVDEKDLEEIAKNTNADCKVGNLPIGTIGHLNYDRTAEETKQPPWCSLWSDFKVTKFGPDNSVGITATHYVRKKMADEAAEYPRRSPDYNIKTKKISGIALLKREAQMPLGVIGHGNDPVISCAFEEGSDAGMGTPEVNRDPTSQPNANDPDPKLASMMEQCCAQYMAKNYPGMTEMHSAHMAAKATPPATGATPTPGAVPPAMPAPAAPTAPAANPMPAARPQTQGPPMQHTAETTPAQFAKFEADWNAKFETERAERIKIERELMAERRRKEIAQFAKDNGKKIDVEAEVKEVMDFDGAGTPMNAAQYEKHVKRFAQYQDEEIDIADLPRVQMAATGIHGKPDANAEPTAKEHEQVMQFMREEAIQGRLLHDAEDYDKVLRKVRGVKE